MTDQAKNQPIPKRPPSSAGSRTLKKHVRFFKADYDTFTNAANMLTYGASAAFWSTVVNEAWDRRKGSRIAPPVPIPTVKQLEELSSLGQTLSDIATVQQELADAIERHDKRQRPYSLRPDFYLAALKAALPLLELAPNLLTVSEHDVDESIQAPRLFAATAPQVQIKEMEKDLYFAVNDAARASEMADRFFDGNFSLMLVQTAWEKLLRTGLTEPTATEIVASTFPPLRNFRTARHYHEHFVGLTRTWVALRAVIAAPSSPPISAKGLLEFSDSLEALVHAATAHPPVTTPPGRRGALIVRGTARSV